MPKTQRLIELIMTVNAKRRFTVKELAEEFGVSTRTMLRDLQELSAIGIPLYSEVGPNGGYRVLPNRLLPPISFTETEAVAIFFACQSLELYSSLPFEAESKSALQVLPFSARGHATQNRCNERPCHVLDTDSPTKSAVPEGVA